MHIFLAAIKRERRCTYPARPGQDMHASAVRYPPGGPFSWNTGQPLPSCQSAMRDDLGLYRCEIIAL